MLEFFSGSKSVSKVFEQNGYQVISFDHNSKLSPSICCDILDVTRESLPGSVSFLWFSPDCGVLSRAAWSGHWKKKTLKYRQYEYYPVTARANNTLLMISKVVEIISWFPEVPFVIENPIGRLPHLPYMRNLGHYRYFVNYFNFDFPYSKETYLFTNIQLPFSTKKSRVVAPGLRTIHSTFERSKVPSLLAEFICKSLSSYSSNQNNYGN